MTAAASSASPKRPAGGAHGAQPHQGVDPIIVAAAIVQPMPKPNMGGEAFSFMLNEKQDASRMLGGRRTSGEAMVHHPKYDFNDAILPVGASYFAKPVEQRLPCPEGV